MSVLRVSGKAKSHQTAKGLVSMCGRFIISKGAADLARWFGTTGPLPNSRARYNAAPSQDVAVVRYDAETKERTLDTLRWGLIPFWAKEAKVGYTMINAKAETVAEKPAYREAFKSRRRDQSCLRRRPRPRASGCLRPQIPIAQPV